MEKLEPEMDYTVTQTGARYTIFDAFRNPMPLLYYVARPGRSGGGDQGAFAFENNVRFGYLKQYPELPQMDAFYTLITRDLGVDKDPAVIFDDRMYNQESFILLSAGADGEYFNDDDQVNFDRPKQ